MPMMADNLQVFHGFCRGNNAVSKAICALDVTPFEGQWYRGRWSHTYWLFRWTLCWDCMSRDRSAQTPQILELMYESHWAGGVQITPYARLLAAVADGRVAEHIELATHYTPQDSWALWDACLKIHGQRYDRSHLLKFYGWLHYWRRKNANALLTVPKVPWFITGANTRYICSEVTEETAREIGQDLCGTISTPQTTSPNTQWFVLRGQPSILDSLTGTREKLRRR